MLNNDHIANRKEALFEVVLHMKDKWYLKLSTHRTNKLETLVIHNHPLKMKHTWIERKHLKVDQCKKKNKEK